MGAIVPESPQPCPLPEEFMLNNQTLARFG